MLRKSITYIIVVLILVGCTAAPNDGNTLPPTAPEEETQPTAVPSTDTALPPTEVPTVTPTPTAAPTATAVPSDVLGNFNHDSRVVPDQVDPVTQKRKMIELYRAALVNDKHHLEWYGAAISPETIFLVWISTLSKDAKEAIKLIYPIRATITLMDIPANHLNVASPMGGGGGGYINEMSPFILEPGQIEISPKGDIVDELRYDFALEIGHDFSFTCGQTGVYNIHFEFPYRKVSETGSEVEGVFPYDVIFACPESFTQYYVDTFGGDIKNVVEWIVKDGEYILQDNQQSQP